MLSVAVSRKGEWWLKLYRIGSGSRTSQELSLSRSCLRIYRFGISCKEFDSRRISLTKFVGSGPLIKCSPLHPLIWPFSLGSTQSREQGFFVKPVHRPSVSFLSSLCCMNVVGPQLVGRSMASKMMIPVCSAISLPKRSTIC